MKKNKIYPLWFLIPALTIYSIFFLLPLVLSIPFSLTYWNLSGIRWAGLGNFRLFFTEHSLQIAIPNTLKFAVLTSAGKVIISFFIAVFLVSKIRTKNVIRSIVYFPNLVSAIAIGLTFSSLMHPTKGLFNQIIMSWGGEPVNWLGNPKLVLYSIILVDIWKGISNATIIYIAGLQSIDRSLYEAAEIDGASNFQVLKKITLPLIKPSMNTIIILSLIGGLRSFDMIWSMSGGGPGFASDVLGSIIYKQYAGGFYGLSTAGNVIMFFLIALIAYPLNKFLVSREVQ